MSDEKVVQTVKTAVGNLMSLGRVSWLEEHNYGLAPYSIISVSCHAAACSAIRWCLEKENWIRISTVVVKETELRLRSQLTK
jgi:hypothetical protein